MYATRDLGYQTVNTKWQKADRYLKDTLERAINDSMETAFGIRVAVFEDPPSLTADACWVV